MKEKDWTETAIRFSTAMEENDVGYIYVTDFLLIGFLGSFFLGTIQFLYRDTTMALYCFYSWIFLFSIAKAVKNKKINKIKY